MRGLDTLYREALKEIAPKPDPRKGFTVAEIAEQTGQSVITVQRNMPRMVAAKVVVADEDYRADTGGRMRKMAVYRFVKGKR